MRKKILMTLALLLTAATGAWAEDFLYLVVDGTSATMMYGADKGDNPYYAIVGGDANWYVPSAYDPETYNDKMTLTTVTIDASCKNYTGTTLESLFDWWSKLTTINGLENLNTSAVTDMHRMFAACQALTSLDLSCLNTASVTNMREMFNALTLETIDLSGWDTSNVTDMYCMFYYCSNLKNIYVGDGWSTASVTNGKLMFSGCPNLPGFDSGKVTYAMAKLVPDGYLAEPPIEVTPVAEPAANTKQWTFSMPGSDVVLTPRYAAATIYQNDGETEKQAYETLKEAFANVQDGDVIKLDWNVTLTEYLETPTIDGGVKFTLDFNGYTLDGGTTYQIQLKNAGDQLTFTDSSDDQLGGLIAQDLYAEAGSEFVFDAGRYNLNGVTAETINGLCADTSSPFLLAEGKEFVDLEGAPVNGFLVRVAYKSFELAIGAGKFATFYSEYKVQLDEATSGVTVYTVSGIDTDRSLAYVSPVSGVVAKETPILLYNATDNELTAKLTVTPDDATAVEVAPEFKGTAEAREFTATDMADYDYYALIGGKAFAPVYNPGTIGANKCWLEFAKQQTPGARTITLVFGDDATGIDSMVNGPLDQRSLATSGTQEWSMDTWYDLNGRKLNAAPKRKGVYINNGRKVVK